mmetsp:Transcript_101164/g.291283  ORF Transcript_101164/g.291283 Transcript_101164/m.291283 type:complete len:233 (+) Transcript_101164:114-812(+)
MGIAKRARRVPRCIPRCHALRRAVTTWLARCSHAPPGAFSLTSMRLPQIYFRAATSAGDPASPRGSMPARLIALAKSTPRLRALFGRPGLAVPRGVPRRLGRRVDAQGHQLQTQAPELLAERLGSRDASDRQQDAQPLVHGPRRAERIAVTRDRCCGLVARQHCRRRGRRRRAPRARQTLVLAGAARLVPALTLQRLDCEQPLRQHGMFLMDLLKELVDGVVDPVVFGAAQK